MFSFLQIVFQLALAMGVGQISNGSKELGSMKHLAELKWRSGWIYLQDVKLKKETRVWSL